MDVRALRIAFIDSEYPQAYDGMSVQQRACGGAEASLARAAHALAQAGCAVVVFQRGRERVAVVSGVWYLPLSHWAHHASPLDVVVHQRQTTHLLDAVARFPQARQIYWSHNFFENVVAREAAALAASGAWVVGVSDYHVARLRAVFRREGHWALARRTQRVYNLVDEAFQAQGLLPDPHLISFTSAPNRGLDEALRVVAQLRQRDARFRLQLFTPSYVRPPRLDSAVVVANAQLAPAALTKAVAPSLAVLQPNLNMPETFGLVYAEANALGVPVLTHHHGAAFEVLRKPSQVINAHHTEAMVDRLWAWSQGQRPQVQAQADFQAPAVVAAWLRLMRQPEAPARPRRVAVVTPSYERAAFLAQAHRLFSGKQTDGLSLRWFVLDDSAEEVNAPWTQDPRVDYRCLSERMVLGAKRNALNDATLAWGADVVVAMDDDDWYGPDYVQSMVDVLDDHPEFDFVGSEVDHLWEVSTGRVAQVPPIHGTRTCNNFMAYRASVLPSHRYADDRAAGEEPAFLGRALVAQHPDPRHVHLALAHASNTMTKRNYFGPKSACELPGMGLGDFVQDVASRRFYLSLKQASKQELKGEQ